MTKYYLDTEFVEDGKTIDLISLALIAEDNRELYLLNADCDWSKADDWVKENVLRSIPSITSDEAEICRENSDKKDWTQGIKGRFIPYNRFSEVILDFCDPDTYGTPEFIAYYADYNWVAFCQTFGKMIDLPSSFPMYCKDLKQELDNIKSKAFCPDFYNALQDAQWVKQTYEKLGL